MTPNQIQKRNNKKKFFLLLLLLATIILLCFNCCSCLFCSFFFFFLFLSCAHSVYYEKTHNTIFDTANEHTHSYAHAPRHTAALTEQTHIDKLKNEIGGILSFRSLIHVRVDIVHRSEYVVCIYRVFFQFSLFYRINKKELFKFFSHFSLFLSLNFN